MLIYAFCGFAVIAATVLLIFQAKARRRRDRRKAHRLMKRAEHAEKWEAMILASKACETGPVIGLERLAA